MSPALAAAAPPAAEESKAPITVEADTLRTTVDQETVAEGAVELRQGGLRLRADKLRYRQPTDRAVAEGHVVIERAGAVYRGDALEVTVNDFSGWFIAPEFDFPLIGTRGSASRIDFESKTRFRAQDARYTSCPRDDRTEPDWELQARAVALDFDANEGVADGARLRFKGVTILALPKMSFPVTDARKSGWLPPTLSIDSRSGLDLTVPYYWNLAPGRDATIAPRVITRRGFALDAEFRYLAPDVAGETAVIGLPYDRLTGDARYSIAWRHRQQFGPATSLVVDALRVSDDAWWKDFSRPSGLLTPRLLPARAQVEHALAWGGLDVRAYARVLDWQVLQQADAPIIAPYTRRPQLGLSGEGPAGPFEFAFESELNRFERPANDAGVFRTDGWRWHAAGSVAWPWRPPGGWVVPRLALNVAEYRTDDPMDDGRRSASRVVPTLSFDAGLEFERNDVALFGRPLHQTLEPRLLYVYTPYRRQQQLPDFDAFGRDFNFTSIYATNAFSGVDRVSDANQLTLGIESRLIDPDDGAVLLRLGAVQRLLFDQQRVAPAPDGSVDGPPLEQKFSDLLLLGSTRLWPAWNFDASLQYSPESRRLNRSVLGATWTPAPFRTLSARYRLARGISEQVEVGWQWPVFRGAPAGGAAGGGCGGTLYSVGRVNYNLQDSRITDSLVGVEYDAGCWIARVVAERQSTGRTEATTRLMLQLELVGLSRLGSNPLRALKDNIPGYRLLRDDDRFDSAASSTLLP
ncbi:MAG: LPS assembly protein LptD [Rubrivivax sp.]